MKTPLALIAAASIATAVAQTNTPDADNTGRNKTQDNHKNKTSEQQSNKEPDIKLAADIRKRVVADDSLSMTAKNSKIIVRDGLVTLRGPVDSAAEKSAIERHAKDAGASTIENELTIKKD